MAFYRTARGRMSRAMTRAMARTGNKQINTEMLERMVQNSRNRFGGAIGRTVATSIAAAIDANVAFNAAEFLFFDAEEDDDGTNWNTKDHPAAPPIKMPTTTSDVPRVSANFPRVPAGCEAQAETFFACFYQHGKQAKDTPDATIGERALQTCAASAEAYNKCVDAAMEKAPKKLFRVPEAYRVREE